MHKRIGFLILVALTMVLTLGAPKVMETLGDLKLFHVVEVTVEGNRYLTSDEVVDLASILPEASIWDEKDPIVSRILEHPTVLSARVKRRIPGRLILDLTEREPVALLPDPVLAPVDVEGRILPIDPVKHRLDLPLMHPVREGARSEEMHLTPSQIRSLASELGRVGEMDPDVLASVSEVSMDVWGDLSLFLDDPRVVLQYHPPLTDRVLRDGLVVLADALRRHPDRRITAVDLRFADQVVVRSTVGNGR
jgi:cell division septal protein FtsQ